MKKCTSFHVRKFNNIFGNIGSLSKQKNKKLGCYSYINQIKLSKIEDRTSNVSKDIVTKLLKF